MGLMHPAVAAECVEKACIDVYTQDGAIVIEGRRGSGPSEKKSVAPVKPRKPIVKKSVAPPPKGVTPRRPSVVKPRAPRTPKPAISRSATSLNDKLVELLPTAGIAYSPAFEPLIKVPVYFWSDVPEVVKKKISIVGEIVDVQLSPTFIWHYGDGVVFATRSLGADYPDGQIRHTYSVPGHYLVELITSWDGQFTVQGVTARIPGSIKTVSVVPITVIAAPSRFTEAITSTTRGFR